LRHPVSLEEEKKLLAAIDERGVCEVMIASDYGKAVQRHVLGRVAPSGRATE
jgi:hypothetical protein